MTDSGTPALSVTNSFTLTVNEVNVAPELTLPANQTISELVAFSANATATDADLPANTLTFALVSGPTGLTVSPSGAIAWTPTETQGPSVNVVAISVTDSGTPSLSATYSFTLTVNEANLAPVLTVPDNATINELSAFSANATATDADLPAQNLTFALVSGPSGLTVSPSGAIAWTPTEAQGPSVNVVAISVTDSSTPNLSVTNSFTLTVNELNVAPVLTVPDDATISELVAFSASATATDADLPAHNLTFTLVSGPTGLTVSPTGAIAWTPTEAQGPGTYPVQVKVSDNGTPALSVTNGFTLTVNEVNVAPVLSVPFDQTLRALTALSVSASATDSDLPANALTFALVSAPTGMTIDSASGLITWTPSQSQSPTTNVVLVSATDFNQSAVNAKSLSVINTFIVSVTESNLPPGLTVPADQTINELSLLSVSASATDPNIPPKTLTFSLASAPVGMSINPNTGLITWTPSEAQGPSANVVVVRVANSVGLSASRSFQVAVNEVNVAPVLTMPNDATINELTLYTNNAAATDADLPANNLTFTLVSGPSGLTVSPTGAIAWTPTEAQGPGTYPVQVKVSDNGTPALSVTNSFNLTVNELNKAPVLTLPGNQTINELVSFGANATATDADLPAQTLTFALVSGPTGLTVSPSGALAWTPTEAQGPGTYPVQVKVTDTGSPALSVTHSFTLTVNEVNVAPVLTVPANQTINELVAFSANATATDADLPANNLTFALVSGPSGLTVSPSGAIAWTPTEAQDATTNLIRVSVSDTNPAAVNTRSLSATNSFTVVVNRTVVSRPLLEDPVLTSTKVTLYWTSIPGRTYRLQYSTNLNSNIWIDLPDDVIATGAVASKIDRRTIAPRFYRVELLP